MTLRLDRPPALDQAKTLANLERALAFVEERREVRGSRFGTIGFCMGGTLVLDLAAKRGDLASVSYYGFPASARPNVPAPLESAARMRGPILGHWGTEDAGVGLDNVRALDEKLKHAKVEHTFHEYEGLGHGFLRASLEKEGAPGYEQACESWKRTLEFWSRTLA